MPNYSTPQTSDGGVMPPARTKRILRRLAASPSLTLYIALLACLVGVRLNNQRLDDVIPTHAVPADNARDWYLRAVRAMRDPERVARIVLPAETQRPVQKPGEQGQGGREGSGSEESLIPAGGTFTAKGALLAQNHDALHLLWLHGFHRQFVSPPIRGTKVRLLYLRDFRRLACLLRLEAQVESECGDWSSAVSADLQAVRMGEDMARGGVLAEKRAGAGYEEIGRADLWKYLPHLSAPASKEAAQKLENIMTAHVSYAETLQEEQRMYQAGMISIIKHDDLMNDLHDEGIAEYEGIEDKPFFRAEWWRALPHSLPGLLYGRRWSLDAYNRMMAARIAWARLPYAVNVTNPQRAPTWSHLAFLLPNDALNVALLPQCTCLHQGPQPDYERLDAEERNTAQNALLLAALALRAYHAEHGRWPTTLAALVPAYLRHAPADPFAPTTPLHYHPHGAAYTLYSVGPDGYDNNGRPIDDKSRRSTPQEHHSVTEGSNGDIVAGINF